MTVDRIRRCDDSAGPAEGPPPDAAYVVALASLPAMGPARLATLLAGRRAPAAWSLVLDGDRRRLVGSARGVTADVVGGWRRAALDTDVAVLWERHAGVRVLVPGQPGFPVAMSDDPEPPAVLFATGDVPSGPAVALVGTRRCTAYGREVAHQLGAELSAAGVTVVSGLALGIDGAAHRGALAVEGAPPVAVVATGLDRPYPRQHGDLWARVVARGAVMAEVPLGTGPARWRFPARNRLLAGLAHAVVVVESHERGGSMHTVTAAIERGRPVLAVPGPVRSPSSRGTNRLLAEGCPPACDTLDVLVAIGLGEVSGPSPSPSPPAADTDDVLDALGWRAATTGTVAARVGRPVGTVLGVLEAHERSGRVRREGGWWERC